MTRSTDARRLLVHSGTFAVVTASGDITGARGTDPDGLFLRDARHLSRWELAAEEDALTVLTARDDGSVLTPPGTRDDPPAYTVFREQAVAESAFTERIRLVNNRPREQEVRLTLAVAADFADQFELRSDHRSYDKTGARREVRELPSGVAFGYHRGDTWSARTTVTADPAPYAMGRAARDDGRAAGDAGGGSPDHTARTLAWRLDLPPHGTAQIALTARAFAPGAPGPATPASPAAVSAALAADAAAFIEAAPRPRDRRADWPDLVRACDQGLADLARLRVGAYGPDGEAVRVPAAGIPWFLTLFGRDALLTSLFALPYRPALASATLRALAAVQGREHDRARQEQPGRIVHEIRHGELAHFRQVPYGRYYGSIDATPLFLVLLHAHAEATGETGLALRLEQHARRAVGWMFTHGGLEERGYLTYAPDAARGGLANQNWKDSPGAICDADGTQATGDIAVAEVQGYAYDALVRTARLAREVWGDPPYAARLDAAAAGLRDRFHRDFWMERPGFPALALDGDGRQMDALASDAGHLLWSGLLEPEHAERTGRRLLEPDFFSGWGIRTLAAGQAAYHDLSYHRGGVWPHDGAVTALGLARYGMAEEARTVAGGLVDAAALHGWRLPEVMAGYGRSDHPAPVPYPHACSPQAWSAATPLALLTALGGGRAR